MSTTTAPSTAHPELNTHSTLPKLLRVPEFAEYVGLPERSVRHLISLGDIAIVKLRRSVYVCPSEADRLIEDNLVPATRRRTSTGGRR